MSEDDIRGLLRLWFSCVSVAWLGPMAIESGLRSMKVASYWQTFVLLLSYCYSLLHLLSHQWPCKWYLMGTYDMRRPARGSTAMQNFQQQVILPLVWKGYKNIFMEHNSIMCWYNCTDQGKWCHKVSHCACIWKSVT